MTHFLTRAAWHIDRARTTIAYQHTPRPCDRKDYL